MGMYNSFDLFIIRNQFQLSQDDWDVISEKYLLNDEMIRLFQNKLNWKKIAQYQELSEEMIKEYINYQLKDYIELICKYQVLSEEFIHDYRYILDWELILEHQKVSARFIVDHAVDIENSKIGSDEVD